MTDFFNVAPCDNLHDAHCHSRLSGRFRFSWADEPHDPRSGQKGPAGDRSVDCDPHLAVLGQQILHLLHISMEALKLSGGALRRHVTAYGSIVKSLIPVMSG